LRLFSFGGYGLALAALALAVFGANECPLPPAAHFAITPLVMPSIEGETGGVPFNLQNLQNGIFLEATSNQR